MSAGWQIGTLPRKDGKLLPYDPEFSSMLNDRRAEMTMERRHISQAAFAMADVEGFEQTWRWLYAVADELVREEARRK